MMCSSGARMSCILAGLLVGGCVLPAWNIEADEIDGTGGAADQQPSTGGAADREDLGNNENAGSGGESTQESGGGGTPDTSVGGKPSDGTGGRTSSGGQDNCEPRGPESPPESFYSPTEDVGIEVGNHLYAYVDRFGSEVIVSSPRAGSFCVEGRAERVVDVDCDGDLDWEEILGLGVSIQLHRSDDEGIDLGACTALTFTIDDPAPEMRVGLLPPGGFDLFFQQGAIQAGRNVLPFDELELGNWVEERAPLDLSKIKDIQWQMPTTPDEVRDFEFCVSDIKLEGECDATVGRGGGPSTGGAGGSGGQGTGGSASGGSTSCEAITPMPPAVDVVGKDEAGIAIGHELGTWTDSYGSSLTVESAADGVICLRGQIAQVVDVDCDGSEDYDDIYGASIGLQLVEPQGADASALDWSECSAFTFRIDQAPTQMRAGLQTVSGAEDTFYQPQEITTGENIIEFDSLAPGEWITKPAVFDASEVVKMVWEFPPNADGPVDIDLCITHIELVGDCPRSAEP